MRSTVLPSKSIPIALQPQTYMDKILAEYGIRAVDTRDDRVYYDTGSVFKRHNLARDIKKRLKQRDWILSPGGKYRVSCRGIMVLAATVSGGEKLLDSIMNVLQSIPASSSVPKENQIDAISYQHQSGADVPPRRMSPSEENGYYHRPATAPMGTWLVPSEFSSAASVPFSRSEQSLSEWHIPPGWQQVPVGVSSPYLSFPTSTPSDRLPSVVPCSSYIPQLVPIQNPQVPIGYHEGHREVKSPPTIGWIWETGISPREPSSSEGPPGSY